MESSSGAEENLPFLLLPELFTESACAKGKGQDMYYMSKVPHRICEENLIRAEMGGWRRVSD